MKLTVGCLAYFDSFSGMVPAKDAFRSNRILAETGGPVPRSRRSSLLRLKMAGLKGTREMRRTLKTRDEVASWLVSIYQDAFAFKYTHEQLMAGFQRVYESRDWKRLTQRDREYCHGYARCYDRMVIYRQLTESGSWVNMPDGSIQYFGVRERLGLSNKDLDAKYPMLAAYGIHRYIHENQIPERSGIFWVDDTAPNGPRKDPSQGDWNGKYPFFIPELHSADKVGPHWEK